MRTITLEEHFASPAFMDGPGKPLREQARSVGALGQQIPEQLCDLGDERIAAMDAADISMQVLSLTAPGVEQLEPDVAETLARESNDYLADAVRRYPQRLAGFASLPVAKPGMAVKELERMVQNHGFPGAVIIGHMGETLPFMIQRMDHTMTPKRTKLKRPIGAYLRENIHYTFSWFNYTSITCCGSRSMNSFL